MSGKAALHPLGRSRLSLLLAAPVLVVLAVTIVVSAIFAVRSDPVVPTSTRAGLARIGGDVALVIVTDGGGDQAATASGQATALWVLVASAVALAPALGAGWVVAGRVLGIVERAQAETEAASDERRTRLQEVVHELRTPLAVMGTNLELASAEVEMEETASGYIDAARRAVDRMGRTVDDLDGHGRLAVEQSPGPVDLAALAAAVVADHAGPGRARGIHVVSRDSVPVSVPAVDPAAVRTAIGNFLDNAVRLAPRGSSVTVDWGRAAGWAWLAVVDEGPGLAQHFHARVFERGWRGPHDRDRDPHERGLGLTIARQLTEAQGGAVTLESEEGGGTTLTLWLPLGNDAERSAVVSPDQIHPAIQPWLEPVATA